MEDESEQERKPGRIGQKISLASMLNPPPDAVAPVSDLPKLRPIPKPVPAKPLPKLLSIEEVRLREQRERTRTLSHTKAVINALDALPAAQPAASPDPPEPERPGRWAWITADRVMVVLTAAILVLTALLVYATLWR